LVPELVWFTHASDAVWHAGFNDQLEALCGAETMPSDPWQRHIECRPDSACSSCVAEWYKMNAAVGVLLEESRNLTDGP
jgi:hypothetical protein